MRHRRRGAVASGIAGCLVGLLCSLVFAATGAAAGQKLNSYEVEITEPGVLTTLAENGFDIVEGRSGSKLEIVATPTQVQGLAKQGVEATLKSGDGETARGFAAQAVAPDGSYDVYRPYYDNSCTAETCYVGRDADGDPRLTIYQELQQLADENRSIVQPVVIGRSLNGVPMLALRVTRDAREATNPAGSKPAVLYGAAQHAREWITPETTRRLAHLFIDNYGETGDALGTDGELVTDDQGDPIQSEQLTRLVNTRELWFVTNFNPDGYDFTFTPGNRLWRKNLREVNGDPGTQTGDGVDLNRNLPTYWGYDNEGSADDPSDETYRGAAPASEPESRAVDGLLKRVGFEFFINYHSAAELLLYGHGFQVQTASPDDTLYQALSGTDVDPAIGGRGPGAPDPYDPDISSELYTTNGELTEHAHSRYGTLAWTPEMDVADPERGGCLTSDEDCDDAEDLLSDFIFQDSDADLEDAFEKNVPFALDVAESADDPDNPESHLDRTAPAFQIRPFDVSYGDPQPVSIIAKRALGDLSVHWQVNGGAEQTAATSEYDGGERYGNNQDVYYREVRGEVTGTAPGDDVKVWFEGGGQRSQAFTYSVQSDSGNRVLVLAVEDYSGAPIDGEPAYPAGDGPFYAGYYGDALAANGIGYDVYDVDAQGRQAPDPLGVLSHYDAVVWYTGNDLITRGPGQGPGTGVERAANDTIVGVRDYLNEGGKLLYTGQYAPYAQNTGFAFNVEGEPPFCPPGPDGVESPDDARAGACIPISNDFLQYWLGAFSYTDAAGSTAPGGGDPAAASALDLELAGGPFGSTAFSLNGADSAQNQEHVYSMLSTGSVLPPEEFPLFDSELAVKLAGPNPYDPVTGSGYAVAESDDEGWQRLRKTIDLTAATSSADLTFQISYDTEPAYDYVMVEAHPVGSDEWTTLPDANGNTSTDVGESCGIDWRSLHPFLDHYQTAPACTPTGTTGEWNAATGNSGGYQEWSIDLSDYAGQQVEVSISYVQDFAFSGLGAFVDDATVTVDGAAADATSFEGNLGGFAAGPPPAGSEGGTQLAWKQTGSLGFVAGPGLGTEDTLTWGFGFEGIGDAATRAEVMGNAMRYLGVLTEAPPEEEPPGEEPPGGEQPPEEPPGGEPGDTTAPQTKITKSPDKRSKKANAKFKFRSNEANSSFECKLKGPDVKRKLKRWRECDSPQKYRKLETGRFKFKVRATDAAGNRDRSPAKFKFKVVEEKRG